MLSGLTVSVVLLSFCSCIEVFFNIFLQPLCITIIYKYIVLKYILLPPRYPYLTTQASSFDFDGTISILNSGPYAIMPLTPWPRRTLSLFLSLRGAANSKLNLLILSSISSFSLSSLFSFSIFKIYF